MWYLWLKIGGLPPWINFFSIGLGTIIIKDTGHNN